MSESDSDEALGITPPDIRNIAEEATLNLLPEKSKKLYNKSYAKFMEWRTDKRVSSFSENVLLAYFQDISTKFAPTTLWTEYSILKSTLNIYEKKDISKYTKLHAFLKRKADGYKPKKSKTFSPLEINTFMNQAPDEVHLLTKAAVIFGVMGACRRHELHNLLYENVRDLNGMFIINIMNTKTNTDRTFTITGKYYHVIRKYIDLRPVGCTNLHFFIKYYNGKCTNQNIGINTFGNMGKTVASYLKLPSPELYTGHCFRRTSATLLIDAGGDITALKRHGGWKSTSVAEGYIDHSMTNKMMVSKAILGSIEKSNVPSTSTSHETFIPSRSSTSPTREDPAHSGHNVQYPPSPTFTPECHENINLLSTAPGDINLSQVLKQTAPIIVSNNTIQHLHIHYHK